MKALYKKLNAYKYSHQFVCDFIGEMHKTHCLISYLCSAPLIIAMRRASVANKLKKLTTEQYNVYNQIEKTQSDGILITKLSQNASMPGSKCSNIINKVLEKEGLVLKNTNSSTFQKFYYAATFKLPPHLTGNGSIFFTPKGTIDEIFFLNILEAVEKKIKEQSQSGGTGISTFELQPICDALIKDEAGIPLSDIELILQMLLYENKISIVASTVPTHELDKFITHSKNTYYHLMESIQNIRNKEAKQENQSNKRKISQTNTSNKRRKLNNSNSITIAYDLIDEKPIKNEKGDGKLKWNQDKNNTNNSQTDVGNVGIGKYAHIKFRYNNYSYSDASPFADIPCQSCPVASTCSDDGIINPVECIYLNAWLDL